MSRHEYDACAFVNEPAELSQFPNVRNRGDNNVQVAACNQVKSQRDRVALDKVDLIRREGPLRAPDGPRQVRRKCGSSLTLSGSCRPGPAPLGVGPGRGDDPHRSSPEEISNPANEIRKANTQPTLRLEGLALAAPGQRQPPGHLAELAEVAAAWPGLDDATRAQILALARSSRQAEGGA